MTKMKSLSVEVPTIEHRPLRRGRPVGSRVQRARRHLAESRRAALGHLAHGRAKAADVLLAAARNRAIPVRMPTGLRTARTWRDRAREKALDIAARVVAWKIERDTWRVALERQKLDFSVFVAAIQSGGPLSRLARN